MTCQSVMQPDPFTVLDTATLAEAIELLQRHRIKNLPVVDAQDVYRGLFGVHTLVRRLLPRAATLDEGASLSDLTFVHDTLANLQERFQALLPEPVLAFTDRELRALNPDESIMETLLMLHRHRHILPVADARSGRLLGIVSLLGVLARLTGRPA